MKNLKEDKDTIFPFLKKLSDKMHRDLKYFLEMPSNPIYEEEKEIAKYILSKNKGKNSCKEQNIISKFYGSSKKDREKWQKAKHRIQQTFLRYYTLRKVEEHPIEGIFLTEIHDEYGIKNKKNSEIKRQKKKLKNLLNPNTSIFEYWFLEKELEEHKNQRSLNPALEEMEQKLEEFYLEKKFRCLFEKINRVEITNGHSDELEEDNDFLNWAIQKVKNIKSIKAQIYYKLYTLLKGLKNSVEEVSSIENIIEKNHNSIDINTLEEFYTCLFNFYTKKINRGHHQYAENYLNCVLKLLDRGIVFTNKELPVHILKNSISVALINDDLERAWILFHQHEKKTTYQNINEKLVLALMKATIFLYEEEYNKSFDILNNYKLQDYYHDIDARLLKLQLEYSLQEHRSLILQKIVTFKKVIRGHKKMPTSKRKVYLNFLEVLRQLIKEEKLNSTEFKGKIPKLKWRWLEKMENRFREKGRE